MLQKSIKKLRFGFCSKIDFKDIQTQKDPKKQQEMYQQFVQQKKKQFINELILDNKQKEKTEKDSSPFRDAILFDELLNTQKLINIYDCKGKVFRYNLYKNIAILIFSGFMLNSWWERKEEQKYIYCIPCVCFMMSRVAVYRRFQKHFVDQIQYDTQTQQFQIIMRNFYAQKYTHNVMKHQLLYTEDPSLNAQNINYINIDTLQGYGIGFKFAWKQKELFSHLLQQRIT